MTKKRLLAVLIVISLFFAFSSVGRSGASYGALNTIDASPWAIEDIEEAVFYGLVPSELLSLSLKDSITREEFASLAVTVWEKEKDKKAPLPEENPFSDTDNENVAKAFQLKIVNGQGDGKYGPLSTLTREEAATMLSRLYVILTNKELAATNTKAFRDDKEIQKWAKESVYYMSDKGLFKGNQVNEFMPRNFISREQSLVVSLRMVKEIFVNDLGFGEAHYKAGEMVVNIEEARSAFKYAQYHLIPTISLYMDGDLAESLEAKQEDIMREMGIDVLHYTPASGSRKYEFTMEYSLKGQVAALILNQDINLYKVSPRAQEIQTQLIGITRELISPEMDYYQREKAIHDYIGKNHSYDLDNGREGKVVDESHSLSGLLKNGKGVCDGYAELFYALCLNTKIPCDVVYGFTNGEGHAWNIVNLYDECYHVDVTWNDPVPDKEKEVRYTYFNVTDKFLQSDHKWERNDYPTCDFVTYSYQNKR